MDDEQHSHRGAHFTLTIFPNGKMLLTTPDRLSNEQFEVVSKMVGHWMGDESYAPLIIGQCKVILAAAVPSEVTVQRNSP